MAVAARIGRLHVAGATEASVMSEVPEPYIDQEADTAEQAQAQRGQRPYVLRYETNSRVVTDHISAGALTEAYELVPVLEARIARLEALLREAVEEEHAVWHEYTPDKGWEWHDRARAALDDVEGDDE